MSQSKTTDKAKNRRGELFEMNEEVHVNGYHPKMDGRVFVIIWMGKMDNCESGVMIGLKDKETGNLVKKSLDTNWLIKIKK